MRLNNTVGPPAQPANAPPDPSIETLLANTNVYGDTPRVVTDADLPYTAEDGYSSFVLDVTAASNPADRVITFPASRTTGAQVVSAPGGEDVTVASPLNTVGSATLAAGTVRQIVPYAGDLLIADPASSGTPSWEPSAGSSTGSEPTTVRVYTQTTAYGVLAPVYWTGASWALAQAGNGNTNAIGVVLANGGTTLTIRHIPLVKAAGHGLVPGQVYWLSPTSSGAYVTSSPDTQGQYQQPILLVYDADHVFMLPGRPVQVGL